LCVAALLFWGGRTPTERYLTPESGFGYALGILGGSCVLVLLLYPARKRARWLAFLGPVKRWFQTHMVLGVLAPVFILFHSNFGFGATNSNVALVSMLVVAGSGLFGRYFYSRIHHGLYGRKATLAELQDHSDRLRSLAPSVAFLPELIERLEQEEQRVVGGRTRARSAVGAPLAAWLRAAAARRRLRRYVRGALRQAAVASPTVAAQQKRLRRSTFGYVDTRLGAARRVAVFQAFERLLSLWHVLHLPLFFMLLIAGIVHVVAVHVY
jgi:hypothetical protein